MLNLGPFWYKINTSYFSMAGKEGEWVGRKSGFSAITNVHGDGAIIIPEKVRSRLGLKPHDHLLFQLRGEQIVASKVKDESGGYSAGIGDGHRGIG